MVVPVLLRLTFAIFQFFPILNAELNIIKVPTLFTQIPCMLTCSNFDIYLNKHLKTNHFFFHLRAELRINRYVYEQRLLSPPPKPLFTANAYCEMFLLRSLKIIKKIMK